MSFECKILQARLRKRIKFFYVLVLLHTLSQLRITNGAAEQDTDENDALQSLLELPRNPSIILKVEGGLPFDETSNKQNLTEFIELESSAFFDKSNIDLRAFDALAIDSCDSVTTKHTSGSIEVPDIFPDSDARDDEIDVTGVGIGEIIDPSSLFERSGDVGNEHILHPENIFGNAILSGPEKLNSENASPSEDDLATVHFTLANLSLCYYERVELEDQRNFNHITNADTDNHGNRLGDMLPREEQSMSEMENVEDESIVTDDANGQDIADFSINIAGSATADFDSNFNITESIADMVLSNSDDTSTASNSTTQSINSSSSSSSSGSSSGSSSSGSSTSSSSSGSSSSGSSSRSSSSRSSSSTVLSGSLDSRIRRLAALVEDRRDLIDNYNTQQMEEETIMNSLNRHIMAALQHRPLVPLSDSACSWSYLRERCEPPCECHWDYKFGDIHPGRSCRRIAPSDPVQDSAQTQQYPRGELEVLDPRSAHDSTREQRDHIPDYSATVSAYPLLAIRDDFPYFKSGQCDPNVWTPGPVRIAVTKLIFAVKMIIDFISEKMLKIRFDRL